LPSRNDESARARAVSLASTQVERWFGLLTDKRLRRCAHRSIQALENDIGAWIDHWKRDPKPFTSTKTADEILERLPNIFSEFPARDTRSAVRDRFDTVDALPFRASPISSLMACHALSVLSVWKAPSRLVHSPPRQRTRNLQSPSSSTHTSRRARLLPHDSFHQ
jgi:hypothetical protein